MIHDTFIMERSYGATPERVFGAFADPVRKRRWFVEGEGHEIEHYEMDFRVGGEERARFRFQGGAPPKTMACTNETRYQDIVANRRIVFASTMSIGDQRISASLVTVELLPAQAGTDLILTHQAAFFEGSDGPQRRKEGWRLLLERLTGEVLD